MEVIETTCTHTKQNVLELERELHHRTFRICMLLSLGGLALLAAGMFLLDDGFSIFIGIFWTIFFLIMSGHGARKSTRSTMKHYKKLYGGPVVTKTKFYRSMLTAKNETTGSETKAKYEDVEQVIVTQHLYTLILPDRIAIMVDRRELTPETDTELYNRLLQGCSAQAFVRNEKK